MTDFEKELESYYFSKCIINNVMLFEERGVVDFEPIIKSIIDTIKECKPIQELRFINGKAQFINLYKVKVDKLNDIWLYQPVITIYVFKSFDNKDNGAMRINDCEIINNQLNGLEIIVKQFNVTNDIDLDKLTLTLWHELHHAYRYYQAFSNDKENKSKENYFKIMSLYNKDFSQLDSIIQTIVTAYYNTNNDEINAKSAETYKYVLNNKEITPKNYFQPQHYNNLPISTNIKNAEKAIDYLDYYLSLDKNQLDKELNKFNSYCSDKNIGLHFDYRNLKMIKLTAQNGLTYAKNQLFKVLGKAFIDRGEIREIIDTEINISNNKN